MKPASPAMSLAEFGSTLSLSEFDRIRQGIRDAVHDDGGLQADYYHCIAGLPSSMAYVTVFEPVHDMGAEFEDADEIEAFLPRRGS